VQLRAPDPHNFTNTENILDPKRLRIVRKPPEPYDRYLGLKIKPMNILNDHVQKVLILKNWIWHLFIFKLLDLHFFCLLLAKHYLAMDVEILEIDLVVDVNLLLSWHYCLSFKNEHLIKVLDRPFSKVVKDLLFIFVV
jgi:hypothetical protein